MPQINGPMQWSLSRDKKGYRTYKLLIHVVADDTTQGPFSILEDTPGMPLPGSVWAVDDDEDVWAICTWVTSIKQRIPGEPNIDWDCEFEFSTDPDDQKRCQDRKSEDPLQEPMKLSGSWSKKTKEATKDRNGDPILNQAYEVIRGPSVEFDDDRPTVKIEQNVPDLQLELLAQMINTVNDSPLWGLDGRQIKLSSVSWERLYHGQCYVYYKRSLEFECNDTFDRDVLDEGTKVLRGHWATKDEIEASVADPDEWVVDDDADPFNPKDYVRYKDPHGENTRVVYSKQDDKKGQPAESPDDVNYVHVEYYDESNFLLLGIPIDLNDPSA